MIVTAFQRQMSKFRFLVPLLVLLTACNLTKTVEQYDIASTTDVTVLEQKTDGTNASTFTAGGRHAMFMMSVDTATGKAALLIKMRTGGSLFIDCSTATILHKGERFAPTTTPTTNKLYEDLVKCTPGSVIDVSRITSSGKTAETTFIEFDLPPHLAAPLELTLPRVSPFSNFLERTPQPTVTYKLKKFAEGGGWH